MIGCRDQIAMMKLYHLILIFLAIYFQNIFDETLAESLEYQEQYPEICYENAGYPNYYHKITCKHHSECTQKYGDPKKGVCVHARNNKEK